MRREKRVIRLAALLGAGVGIGMVPTGPARAAPDRAPESLRATMLAAHNAARAAVGVPALAWDAGLAADARAHAEAMARTGRYQHAVQPAIGREGENLWRGVRDVYDYRSMAATWVDEARVFVNRPAPAFSATGRWQDVGHYSQIVWRTTTAVGCAIASDATYDYVVCRYGPPGNVIGRLAF